MRLPRLDHRNTRLLAGVLVGGVLIAGCGADVVKNELSSLEPDDGSTNAATTDGTAGGERPGDPVSAEPAQASATTQVIELPPAEAPTVPETVELHTPDLLVTPPADSGSGDLYRVFGVSGVEHLAGASRFDASIVAPARNETLQVLAVDPTTFRPMTPEVTAQSAAVWQRVAEGDVLVRHDVAYQLGLVLGDSYDLTGPDGTTVRVRIGAFASNAAPPLADVIVPWEVGSALGSPDVNLLVIALGDDVRASRAGDAIVERLGGGDVEVRERLERQQARLTATRRSIEPFTFVDLGDGMIVQDPNWVRQWIVTVDLPRVGRTRVHRLMAPQLLAAMDEVRKAGLLDHFDPSQFAGGWVPRHIDWNPRKPLSNHAWGLAVDFNSRDNCLGCQPVMDQTIVQIFERWGFNWGGYWSRPDGMHFELARFVEVP